MQDEENFFIPYTCIQDEEFFFIPSEMVKEPGQTNETRRRTTARKIAQNYHFETSEMTKKMSFHILSGIFPNASGMFPMTRRAYFGAL